MEEFILKGGSDFLKITINEVFGFPHETSHFGGYDTKSIIEIECDNFKVKTHFWITTGDIFELYSQLVVCNTVLSGNAFFRSSEGNLNVEIKYDVDGHLIISGSFSKQNFYANKLTFYFESDQSYIQQTLYQLKIITDKYGGMDGIDF